MIPKTIHYCWFGKKPLPDKAKKCLQSWVKFFPDYEIKEWNESNFDLNCSAYVKEAYEARKWAFVSDYVRFWVLFQYGGLYFDTDVEVIKPMDVLIEKGSFMGCELETNCNVQGVPSPNPGLGLSAAPGLGLYKEILEYYDTLHFHMNNDGTYDTVVDHTTNILKKHGFRGNGQIETIEGITIYPPEYFCPMNYRTGEISITKNTYTIHWYSASWQTNFQRFKTQMKYLLGTGVTYNIINIRNKFRNKNA